MQRKTAKDRFTRALREIGHWCRAHCHWPVAAQQAALRRKLQGHYLKEEKDVNGIAYSNQETYRLLSNGVSSISSDR